MKLNKEFKISSKMIADLDEIIVLIDQKNEYINFLESKIIDKDKIISLLRKDEAYIRALEDEIEDLKKKSLA